MNKRLLLTAAATVAALALAPARPFAAPTRPLEIYFVDVEGGAATLLVTPTGESVLVDSGWPRPDGRDAKRIEHAARYVAGLTQIDHYVTTHWHTDHYGGIEALAKIMPVQRYWDKGVPAQSPDGGRDFPMLIEAYKRASGGKSSALKAGDRLPLRATAMPLELKVVSAEGKVIGEGDTPLPVFCAKHPEAPVKDESDNMRSIGLLLSYGRFQFLNLGDLTWNVEHKLVCPRNRVGEVDLWQVTHHGAPQSGNPALVEAIKPRVAIMQNGPRKGGHPQTFATLKKSPTLQAVYQVHRNVTTRPEDNTAPEKIANLEESCKAEFVRARLTPEADRYTVTVGTERGAQTFGVR